MKSELAKRDLNYPKLAKLMNDKGYAETTISIRSKVTRGCFSFAFALAVADCLGVELNFK